MVVLSKYVTYIDQFRHSMLLTLLVCDADLNSSFISDIPDLDMFCVGM